MPVYCKTHSTLFDPLPSGYAPTQEWSCPEGHKVSRAEMAQAGIIPERVAGIVVRIWTQDGVRHGGMLAFPHGAHL